MLRDALNFIGKLTFVKLWNILLVQLSFGLSNILKKPLVWGNPWFVSVEPASVCNLSCPQCPTGAGDIKRTRKFMDISLYEKLLDEISDTTAMLSLYFQGEPLMNKEFPAFVRLATEKGIYTQTSTSGQFLTEGMCRGIIEGGLDRIIISLDGTDQDSYQAYRRGGELNKVEEGIRILVRQRKEAGTLKPYLIVQFLVFKHNQRQIPEVKEIARHWGADRVWIKSAQMEYRESADEWIPETSEYNRYERDDRGNWKLKGKLRNRCKRLWQATVITSDGLTVPCCFDKRAEFPMGNLENQSLEQIWENESYQEFRKQILGNRKGTGICMNCTEGIRRLKPS